MEIMQIMQKFCVIFLHQILQILCLGPWKFSKIMLFLQIQWYFHWSCGILWSKNLLILHSCFLVNSVFNGQFREVLLVANNTENSRPYFLLKKILIDGQL